MASPKNRLIVSQKSLDKDNGKGDDPWCLTCGVNLALDGRTYTVVSRHNNGELCDIFSRVLGAEFSEDYASVNVCNRCERQLRRLGRYNSIILARHEGEKLREQLEKNLAKHGQKIVESGNIEEHSSPTLTTAATIPSTEETSDSSNAAGKIYGYEGHSSIKKIGKHTSRSASSVHFEDEREAGRREALVRKYSAPEGRLKKRESLSPFSEAERRREARRRKWSSASSTSEENTPASPTISADRKFSLGSRGVALASHQYRNADRSNTNSISADQPMASDELTTGSPSIPQDLTDTPGELTLGDFKTREENITSQEDQDNLLTRSVDQEESLSTMVDQDGSLSGMADQKEPLPRMDTLQADDELFHKLGSDSLKDSAQEGESSVDAGVDPSDFNADNRSNLSDVEERINTKTKFKGAYYNIGSTEDLLQEFANENVRERAMWSKLTFTESVDMHDPNDEPVRPPRRSRSGRSSLKKKGGQLQDTPENEPGVNEETDETAGETGNDVKVNGVAPDRQNDLLAAEDGKTVAKFEMETPGGTDTQATQQGGTVTKKSEKSPLIGKDARLKNGNESRVKDQLPGFLCCAIL